jgi:hypothetical protein
MGAIKDWQEERDQILKWIDSQHEAITISSFEWYGIKMEFDGFWYKADGHEFSSWEYALDFATILAEENESSR